MNYRGIQDVSAGSSGGFKAFYNGAASGAKTVSFTSKAGEVVSNLSIANGQLVPIESREVTSAQAGVFGLY
jgi:hypothetical protein